MPSRENFIYIIVVYSLNDKDEAIEMHNNGWFKELADAEEYMKLAGQPVPGREHAHYDDPFEHRWSHVLIEKVSEGPMCSAEIVRNYKAEWYREPNYENDPGVTELVNKLRQQKFRVVELDEPGFDAGGTYNFSGM